MPYAEREPARLTELLVRVKAAVHPWIRLNRVIRDIPEVSIIAGNSNTNLRQAIFTELKKQGKSCRCIRCREVRDWPETADKLHVRVRGYRSSRGSEFFISVEGGPRGLGGGATQRALAGGKKATKAEKRRRKAGLAEEPSPTAVTAASATAADRDNATLYGLLRLRLNDNPESAGQFFPELAHCALIRELHVYGAIVPARQGESAKLPSEERPQHGGIGRVLMDTAERLAAGRGWERIAVIAGIGVRNYYRRLGYELRGEGQYLIKELEAREFVSERSLELPFLEAAKPARSRGLWRPFWCTAAAVGLAAGLATAMALGHRRHRSL